MPSVEMLWKKCDPWDGSALNSGEAVSITENVTQTVDSLWGGALFSVSQEGTLLFARGAREQRLPGQMAWRDREGNLIKTLGKVEGFNTVQVSNDGRRVAVSIGLDPAQVEAAVGALREVRLAAARSGRSVGLVDPADVAAGACRGQ